MKVLIIPLLAAFAQAASLLTAKISLTRQRIEMRDFMPALFIYLAAFAMLSLVQLGDINTGSLFTSSILVKFAIALAAAVTWNVCYYTGISKEKANVAEGIFIAMPLMTIVVSWFFDWQQFDLTIGLLALIATLITTWAYVFRGGFKFDKYSLLIGLAVIFAALENVLVAQILQVRALSPASLYAIRTIILSAIFYAYYRPKLLKVSLKHHSFIAIAALVGIVMMLLRYYGLRDAGITTTAFILILSPAIVLISANIFLNEKVKPKQVVAMATVIGLVIYASITKV